MSSPLVLKDLRIFTSSETMPGSDRVCFVGKGQCPSCRPSINPFSESNNQQPTYEQSNKQQPTTTQLLFPEQRMKEEWSPTLCENEYMQRVILLQYVVMSKIKVCGVYLASLCGGRERELRVPFLNEQPTKDPPLSDPTIFKERMTQEGAHS